MSKKNKTEAEKVLEEGNEPVETVTESTEPEAPGQAEQHGAVTPTVAQYYRGQLITSDVVDEKHHHGHLYKKFSVATRESFMISPEEFSAGVINK